MKKTYNSITLISVLLVLGFFGVACAGDSITFSVSCTIPAIPGVNAPLEEELEDTDLSGYETTVAVQTEKIHEDDPTAEAQEDSLQTMILAEQNSPGRSVQTYYSR